MKLKEWADKTGVKYLTAYRWFKNGTFPVEAYQTDSGTIIVNDKFEDSEPVMTDKTQNVMSSFLKKTVEYSKNNSSIEEFAAYILSNFSLHEVSKPDIPKYSKNKPKPEDIQNHFKKFIPVRDKPKPNSYIMDPQTLNKIDDNLVNRLDAETADALSIIHKLAEQYKNLEEDISLTIHEDTTSPLDLPVFKDNLNKSQGTLTTDFQPSEQPNIKVEEANPFSNIDKLFNSSEAKQDIDTSAAVASDNNIGYFVEPENFIEPAKIKVKKVRKKKSS